jgi:hypothetical protein
MASIQRYRSGVISEVKSLVAAGVQADVGDLVALIGTPGKLQTFTSAALTPPNFRTNFAGVLVQGYTRGTETTDSKALVYGHGEFEFDLNVPAVAVVDVGGLVAAFADQVVTTGAILGVAGTGTAIGRLARRVEIGDVTALVRIESVLFGGPQPLT